MIEGSYEKVDNALMPILFGVRDVLHINFLTKMIGLIALSSLDNPSCAVFFIGNNLVSIPVAPSFYRKPCKYPRCAL